jgi:hypothetical protein
LCSCEKETAELRRTIIEINSALVFIVFISVSVARSSGRAAL